MRGECNRLDLALPALGLGVLFVLGLIPVILLDYVAGDKRFYVSIGLGNMLRLAVVAVLYVVAWDDYLLKRRAGDTQWATDDSASQQS